MRNAKALADAKRRIDEAETSLLSLDAQEVYSSAIRARLVAELRKALEDYYSLVSGEPQKRAANDLSE
jgi:hypothetical protein